MAINDTVMICPECGGRMYHIGQYDCDGVRCDTCFLIRRPDGSFDRSDME